MSTKNIRLQLASDVDADVLRVEVWVDDVLLMDVTEDVVTVFGPTPTEVALEELIGALIRARPQKESRSP